MQLFFCVTALAAVTVIYLLWRSHQMSLAQRQRVLHERVAHLLWVMADVDENAPFAKSHLGG